MKRSTNPGTDFGVTRICNSWTLWPVKNLGIHFFNFQFSKFSGEAEQLREVANNQQPQIIDLDSDWGKLKAQKYDTFSTQVEQLSHQVIRSPCSSLESRDPWFWNPEIHNLGSTQIERWLFPTLLSQPNCYILYSSLLKYLV